MCLGVLVLILLSPDKILPQKCQVCLSWLLSHVEEVRCHSPEVPLAFIYTILFTPLFSTTPSTLESVVEDLPVPTRISAPPSSSVII